MSHDVWRHSCNGSNYQKILIAYTLALAVNRPRPLNCIYREKSRLMSSLFLPAPVALAQSDSAVVRSASPESESESTPRFFFLDSGKYATWFDGKCPFGHGVSGTKIRPESASSGGEVNSWHALACVIRPLDSWSSPANVSGRD